MNELNKLTDREFIEFFIRAFNAREDIGLTIGVVLTKMAKSHLWWRIQQC